MTLDDIKKIQNEKHPKFSEFAKEQLPMPGVKKRLDEILGKQITVVDYRLRKSKHRDGSQCLQLQFLLDDEICILFTGSSVLINQIERNIGQIPFDGIISKVDRYYSFT